MSSRLRLISILLTAAALTGCAVSTQPLHDTRAAHQVDRADNNQQQLLQRIDELQQQLQAVQAQLQEQQKLTASLQQAATQKGTTDWQKTEPTPEPATDTTPQRSPTELYLQAFADYASGRYPAAIDGFNAFIANYPGNDYAGNAQYWLGECYYAQQDYRQAVQAFEQAAYQYPESGKAPEALWKMVPALRHLNQFEQAREALQLLHRRYPDSPAAARAQSGG